MTLRESSYDLIAGNERHDWTQTSWAGGKAEAHRGGLFTKPSRTIIGFYMVSRD
jgi:hypothetical protein